MLGFESGAAFMAYITCIMLGVTLLFGYNALLSTPLFFQNYYKHVRGDSEATTDNATFWNNATAMISVASMFPNISAQFFLLTPMSRRIRQQVKMMFGLILIVIGLVMVPLMTVTRGGDEVAMGTFLAAVIICALGTGFYQSSATSLVSGFPSNYFGIMISGIGMSGVFTNVLSIVTQAALPADYDGQGTQAIVFYSISSSVVCLTAVLLYLLQSNPFAHKYVEEYKRRHAAQQSIHNSIQSEPNEYSRLADTPTAESPNKVSSAASAPGSELRTEEGGTGDQIYYSDDEESANVITAIVRLSGSHAPNDSPSALVDGDFSTIETMKKIKMMLFVVVYTFTVSLVVMPAVGVAINPKAEYFGILIITMFNVGDTCGRLLTFVQKIWIPECYLPYAALARTLLLPLFFICAKPKLIPGNIFPMFLMFFTGISNGFVGTLSMIYAPSSLHTEQEKNISGNIMSFGLLLGCSIGSGIGLALSAYVFNS